jgi:hypothetical protein
MGMAKASLLLAAATCLIAHSQPIGAQGIRGQDLLGVRIGGVIASGSFADKFGSGSEIDLHFIHGITSSLGIDIAISSHNFGESKDQEKNIEFFGRTDMNLQAFSVTAGMIVLKPVHGRVSATAEAGPGVYSVNAILPLGFYEAQKTDNHLGLHAGAGVLVKLSDSFFITANGSYHTIFVGDGSDDTVHFFTGDSRAEFLQITLGILHRTH